MKAVGRIATLEDEPAGLAVQFATALFEMYFAATRYSDQVTGFAVFADLGFAARVAELARAQARQCQGCAVGFPNLQAAAETAARRELQRQWKIGAADCFGPARLALMLGPRAGGKLDCHGAPYVCYFFEMCGRRRTVNRWRRFLPSFANVYRRSIVMRQEVGG
ncbi:hypothetical protein D3C77_597530 [compost metagenome]